MGSIVHRSVPTNLKWFPTCSHAHALFQARFKDVQVGSRWFSTLYILSPNFHTQGPSLWCHERNEEGARRINPREIRAWQPDRCKYNQIIGGRDQQRTHWTRTPQATSGTGHNKQNNTAAKQKHRGRGHPLACISPPFCLISASQPSCILLRMGTACFRSFPTL